MFSFGKKSTKEISLIFNVGNDNISSTLVELRKNNKPHIFYTRKEHINFDHDITSSKLVVLISELIRKVSERVEKEGLPKLGKGSHKISTIYCVLSSPWYLAETKVIRITREKEQIVTKKFLDEIIQKEEQRFEDESANGEYAHMFGSDIEIVERKIIQAKLNGYEVGSPVGKSAHLIEIALFTSLASKKILDVVSKHVHKHFGVRNITFHTFSLATFSTVRDIFPNLNDLILVDVTGEITEVALVTQGVMSEAASFPNGRSALIRTLSKELRATPEIVGSLLKMSRESHVDPASAPRMEKIIENYKKTWSSELASILAGFAKNIVLPTRIVVTAEESASSIYSSAAESISYTELVQGMGGNTTAKFNVSILDSKILSSTCDVSSNLTPDPDIIVSSLFVERLMNS